MSMEEAIRRKLETELNPSLLEVINQSSLHAGHAGDNGTGESHFHVKIVSNAFAGMSRVDAQRLVHAILEDEIKKGIHALSIRCLSE